MCFQLFELQNVPLLVDIVSKNPLFGIDNICKSVILDPFGLPNPTKSPEYNNPGDQEKTTTAKSSYEGEIHHVDNSAPGQGSVLLSIFIGYLMSKLL